MTRYLVAVARPATAEAACDYLADAVEAGDEVYLLTVADDEDPIPDRSAVSRVAQERLGGRATVRTIRRDGAPDREIVRFAREKDVDQIVLGPNRKGGPGIGSTTRSVLNTVEVPVFVVPA